MSVAFLRAHGNKKGHYDCPFEGLVDMETYVSAPDAIKLLFSTFVDRMDEHTIPLKGKDAAILVLADTNYYEPIERALKDDNYIKKCNIAGLDPRYKASSSTISPRRKTANPPPTKPKKSRSIQCANFFSKRTLETEAMIDAYVEDLRKRRKDVLTDYDELKVE